MLMLGDIAGVRYHGTLKLSMGSHGGKEGAEGVDV